ncbi:MAG TPA: LamG-like jellyroll fold domain-containing protein [Candidatus Udaeobacter sp.]|nr:LamG-like jellyroll fold domain-containing protein [Candidatus Udaeobacter sp.]
MLKRKKILLSLLIIVAALSFLVYQKVRAANAPALKEGTYLTGQTLSVWPSWSLLSNALGVTLPTDPINQLATAGTCATTTNRFCTADNQCPAGEACVLHDPETGWSVADRRFTFACSKDSYAYRYFASTTPGAFTVRAHFEDPGIAPGNFNSFVASFVSTSIVKINDSSGICNFDQEISSIQSGTCGDGKLNLNKGEQCDPPGRIEYANGCVGSIKNLNVCSKTCQWTPSTTLCSNLSKCGNGSVEFGETCDDGNLNGKYNHCNTTCNGVSALGKCGDNVLQSAYEVCDPGTPGKEKYATSKAASCSWDCQSFGPYCDDNTVQSSYGEECDGSQTCSIDGKPGTRICNGCLKKDDDAVAWWRFEQLTTSGQTGQTTDGSINGNTATCSMATCPTVDNGKYGHDFIFSKNSGNSSNANVDSFAANNGDPVIIDTNPGPSGNTTNLVDPHFLTVSNSQSLNPISSLTVEAWIFPTDINALYQRIIEKGGPGTGKGYDLEFNLSATAHTVRFNLWNGTQTSVDSNSQIPLNTWTHIVGTYTRSGNSNIIKIYINGVLENTVTNSSAVPSMAKDAGNLAIGKSATISDNFFFGSLDEVKIYNRALLASEVQNNFQSGWFCAATTTPESLPASVGKCGDGVININEVCDSGTGSVVDTIPGPLGTPTSPGMFSINSAGGKKITVHENVISTTGCFSDNATGRAACSSNSWDYKIPFDQAGKYRVKFITSNYTQNLTSSSFSNDHSEAFCSAPGIQHHIVVSLDGVKVGEDCVNADSAPQHSQAFDFNINSSGNHTLSLAWDNDWYAPNFYGPNSAADSNININKIELIQGVSNGEPCVPTYGKPCAYCAADCQNTIDVQPLQYCGNGIIEGSERCEVANNFIYSPTSTPGRTVSTKDAAYNGYRELACANEPAAPHTINKGIKTCASCAAGVVRNCVKCGPDVNGVKVNGGIINVLDNPIIDKASSISQDPLFIKKVAAGVGLSLSVSLCKSPAGALLCSSLVDPLSPLVAVALKNINSDPISYVLGDLPSSGANPALLSSDPVCSVSDTFNDKYQLYVNSDWTRPLNFPVVAEPQSSQYDLVLSPVVSKTNRPKDLRVVVSWIGSGDLYSGVLNPFLPNPQTVPPTSPQIEGANFYDGSSYQYATGVNYYNSPDIFKKFAVWYHGFNFTPGQTMSEAFTLDTSAMSGNTYSFYVRSPSFPIRIFRGTAKLKAEVYLPEDDNNQYHFGTPLKTYYLSFATPSDNQNARYWQVFNVNQPLPSAGLAASDILDINAIVSSPDRFVYNNPLIPNATCTDLDWSRSPSATPACPASGSWTYNWTKITNCVNGVKHPPVEVIACPICTAADWVRSPATNPPTCPPSGAWTINWTKIGNCTAGVQHQPVETIGCKPCTDADWTSSPTYNSNCTQVGTVVYTWTKIGQCTGGVTHVSPQSVTCRACTGADYQRFPAVDPPCIEPEGWPVTWVKTANCADVNRPVDLFCNCIPDENARRYIVRCRAN